MTGTADSARMAAVAGFKLAQICRPNGNIANTIVAGAPPAWDSATLMAIVRSCAARQLSAAGVEVVFFADSGPRNVRLSAERRLDGLSRRELHS